MKILIATSAPFYWWPQVQAMAEAMCRAGHDASAIAPESLASGSALECDALVCLGTGQSLQPFVDTVTARTRILYLIEPIPLPGEADANAQGRLDAHRAQLPRFDHVFVHTPRSVPTLRSLGVERLDWLVWPHFPTIFAPHAAEQDIDVLFIGTLSNYRRAILRSVAAQFKVAYSNAFHAASAAWYARAKIALNIHFAEAPNFECRVIEALGCGAFLLTEQLDPDNVLVDGQHLVVFDADNVVELVGRYLNDEPARRRIAQAGLAEVQRYRIDKQVQPILAAAAFLTSPSPSRRGPG